MTDRPLVYILNGPNLNLLGQRKPDIYGRETLADVEASCHALAAELGLAVKAFQSNAESGLIDRIHAARSEAAAIVINAGAYTHTSIAIPDALETFDHPIIEVYISNIHRREAFRHHSYISGVATAVIVGCGTDGYRLALRRIAALLGL